MTIPIVQATGLDTTSAEATRRSKLVDAAKQFEAMMLGQMLKPMQFGVAPGTEAGTGSDESGGGAADTVRGIATEALGKALAEHGGVGIARSVLRQVMAEESARHESVMQKTTGAKVQ